MARCREKEKVAPGIGYNVSNKRKPCKGLGVRKKKKKRKISVARAKLK